MNKKQALKEITELISYIDTIKQAGRKTHHFTYWYTNVATYLENVFGYNSTYCSFFRSIEWEFIGSMTTRRINFEYAVEEKFKSTFLEALEKAKGLLLAVKDAINKSENIELLLDKSDVKKGVNTLLKIVKLVESKLRKVIRNLPKNEKEIQDTFENLLIGAEIEYEREFPHIKYSSKNYIPDFSFSRIDTVLEIKFCTETRKEKSLISEINDDIQAYKSKFTNLIFLVYDTGQIRDIEKFSDSFENDSITIRVIKH